MTQEQIVGRLVQVHGLVIRDQEFASGIHDAVDANAIVLDNVVVRVCARVCVCMVSFVRARSRGCMRVCVRACVGGFVV